MLQSAAPTLADLKAAAARIAGVAVRTPLVSSPFLDERLGGRVFLKCETLQRTGSFKFRGAYNALSSLPEAERAKGVIAVSSGNHAQGVAEAARLLGIAATIVMPADAPAVKLARTRRSGAHVVTHDRATEDREAVARAIIERSGEILIHPFNDPAVIAGQGTVGLEIVADLGSAGVVADAVLVPCSGGGLAAGVALAVRSTCPASEIVLVEPQGFDDYGRSLREGIVAVNARRADSVCDALLAASPGAIGLGINRAAGAVGHTVSDGEALAAVAFAFHELKLVVEPGGAVGLAALLSGCIDCRGRTVVVVLSGGNIDAPVLARALATDPASR